MKSVYCLTLACSRDDWQLFSSKKKALLQLRLELEGYSPYTATHTSSGVYINSDDGGGEIASVTTVRVL